VAAAEQTAQAGSINTSFQDDHRPHQGPQPANDPQSAFQNNQAPLIDQPHNGAKAAPVFGKAASQPTAEYETLQATE